jgi:hypothetical protein
LTIVPGYLKRIGYSLPQGVALLMTPVIEGWDYTYENSTVVTPLDRRVHFGQEDQVRYCGADLRKLLTPAFRCESLPRTSGKSVRTARSEARSSLLRPRRDPAAPPPAYSPTKRRVTANFARK